MKGKTKMIIFKYYKVFKSDSIFLFLKDFKKKKKTG